MPPNLEKSENLQPQPGILNRVLVRLLVSLMTSCRDGRFTVVKGYFTIVYNLVILNVKVTSVAIFNPNDKVFTNFGPLIKSMMRFRGMRIQISCL